MSNKPLIRFEDTMWCAAESCSVHFDKLTPRGATIEYHVVSESSGNFDVCCVDVDW